MSTNLFWQPKPKELSKHCLGKDLKYILARRYFYHDGSLTSADPYELTANDIPFLEGIAAVGNGEQSKQAEGLIEAIGKHEVVWITIE